METAADHLRALGEHGLIAGIRARQGGAAWGVRLGIGDDAAALVPTDGDLLITTDTLVEGVHFRFDWTTPRAVGYKTAATNLSDIAAMGGTARWATLALSLPAGMARAAVDALIDGVVERLEAYGAALVGGDTTRSPGPLVVTLTLLGEASPGGLLRRDAAQPGDVVWVAGALGDAALALRLLNQGAPLGDPDALPWRALHDPLPRCALGAALGRSGLVHAAMDVSDGLVQDLGHICRESKVIAEIALERLPLSEALRAHAGALDRSPEAFAAVGGEDYALLFTAPAEAERELRRVFAASGDPGPLASIGRIVSVGEPSPEGEGNAERCEARFSLRGESRAFTRGGWDHFASARVAGDPAADSE